VKPRQSIQKAIDSLLDHWDLNGHWGIVQLADGTYEEAATIPRQPVGQNQISIRGNAKNFASVRWIAPPGQTCCSVQNGGIGIFAYLEMSAPSGGVLVATRQNAVANVLQVYLGPATIKLAATLNSTINCNGFHALLDGGEVCLDATLGGNILMHGQSFSIERPCRFAYFARAIGGGSNVSFMGARYTGAPVSGPKGLAANNGVIDSGGTAIPGSDAVITRQGGVSV